jgi:glyoxylase I family protein
MGIEVEGVAPLFQVFDMPRSVAFYRDVLGFEVITTSLRAQGVELEPPTVAPYGMRQLYLTDPDGYAICFQWPV